MATAPGDWLEVSDPYPEPHRAADFQTSWIDADLAESGLKAEADKRPGEPAAGQPRSISYRWGARYVIEGSRLGAAVLYGRLSSALRPHKLRYLQGDDGTFRPPLAEFLRELRASVRRPRNRTGMRGGVRQL